jgi:hypothetical protein
MTKHFPSKFYKYRKVDPFSLDAIENNYIWFPTPANLNDPFDCATPYALIDPSEEDYKALRKDLETQYRKDTGIRINLNESYFTDNLANEKFKNKVNESFMEGINNALQIFRQKGVACFAQNVDNILMWSHYTDGHKGFCLEFDSQYKPFSDRKKVIKVNYTKSFPLLNPIDVILKRILPSTPTLLVTKSKHWAYEKEWRLIKEKGDTRVPYDPIALTGVYFGCLMPDKQKIKIATILANTPTKLYEMKRSEDSFRLIYLPYSL